MEKLGVSFEFIMNTEQLIDKTQEMSNDDDDRMTLLSKVELIKRCRISARSLGVVDDNYEDNA